MTSAPDPDTAVRNYLLFLEDPSQLIDKDEVARLEAASKSTSDPLERLKNVNRLHQIREGGGDSYREAFCTHAKGWAEANDIQPASFLAMGVDESTLRAAGFSVRSTGAQQTSRRSRQPQRHGQVRVEAVKDAVARQSGQFTLADLAAASGASPMTIRKAVDQMISAGEVERLGPTPNWSHPGRAPIQFRRITKRSRG